MEAMREKLANLGISRPSNKAVKKAVRKAMRTPQLEEYVRGSDPRVDEALRLINEEDMDPTLAVFQAWSGGDASMLPVPPEKLTLDTETQSMDTETQQSLTGDTDDTGPAEEP